MRVLDLIGVGSLAGGRRTGRDACARARGRRKEKEESNKIERKER